MVATPIRTLTAAIALFTFLTLSVFHSGVPAHAVPSPMILKYTMGTGQTLSIPLDNYVPDSSTAVDWGDGTQNASLTHTYSSSGNFTVSITGSAGSFGRLSPGTHAYITEVVSWGNLGLTSLQHAFSACPYLLNVPSTIPATVTNVLGMFKDAAFFNDDISMWDTSHITNMHSMFSGADAFTGDISSWDTRNVWTMSNMFSYADSFNQDLITSGNSWNTSNVTDFSFMFYRSSSFNGNISNWNTGLAWEMSGMFRNATSFNRDISSWDISSMENATTMFSGSALSTLNYSKILRSWATGPHKTLASNNNNSIPFFAEDTYYYSSVASYRTQLINDGWDIYDLGATASLVPIVTTAPTGSAINTGQALTASTLAGGVASVPGTFSYTTPSNTLSYGTNSVSVTFNPTDNIVYSTVAFNITVTGIGAPAPSPSQSSSSPSSSSQITSVTARGLASTGSSGQNTLPLLFLAAFAIVLALTLFVFRRKVHSEI